MSPAAKKSAGTATTTSADDANTSGGTLTYNSFVESGKEGTKTTEFWTTLLVIAAATGLLVLDKITSTEWTTTVGVSGSVYTAARTLLKGKISG